MNMTSSSLADLLGPWSEANSETGLIARMQAAWSKPVDTLTNQELATCLRQKLAVDDLLPVAKKRADAGVVDDSELHDTELVDAIEEAEHWCRVDDEDRKIRGLPPRQMPNQPPQHNAGSRPLSSDPPASKTPSSLGPRG